MCVITVPVEAKGTRVDQYVTDALGERLSRSQVSSLVTGGKIISESPGKQLKPGTKLKGGETLHVTIPPPEPSQDVAPEAIPLEILYEDDEIIIVNKPAGMVVHPARGHPSGTLVNALMSHCGQLSGINGALRPGIVHRLDKDTSGAIVAAKTDAAHMRLSADLSAREIVRQYIAVMWGRLSPREGTVDVAIGRCKSDPRRMAAGGRSSRPAITHYTTLSDYHPIVSVAELRLETGRTHQIRVHMQHTGHPVFGDPDYGGRQVQLKGIDPRYRRRAAGLLARFDRQALHARVLTLAHPTTGQTVTATAPVPADMQALFDAVEF